MGTLKGIRALNAAVRGSLNAAALQSYLGTAENMAGFQQVCNLPGQMAKLAASGSAMTAVAGSALAVTALLASSVALDAVTSSPTAMSQLVASGVTMGTLFADAAARNKMASKSVALDAIAGSAAAMTALLASPSAYSLFVGNTKGLGAFILSQTALDAIFASPTAKTSFKASTVIDRMLEVDVLNNIGATIRTLPSGAPGTAVATTVTCSSFVNASNQQFQAFDNDDATYWISQSPPSNQWVQLQFSSPVFVHSAIIDNMQSSTGRAAKNIRLEYSDDGANWTTALTTVLANNTQNQAFDIAKPGKHAYWRVFCVDNYGDATNISINNVNLIGFF